MTEPKVGGSRRGNAGKGRKKGSHNKLTRSVKDAIAFAANGLGGAERLIEWAQEDDKNEHSFWTQIYPKLLPLDVNANVNGNIGMPPITLSPPA